MKRWLSILLLVGLLTGCSPRISPAPSEPIPIQTPDFYPQVPDATYAMTNEEYLTRERLPVPSCLPENTELKIDSHQLLMCQDGTTAVIARLPETCNWQSVVGVTQIGALLQSDTGLWLVSPQGGIRCLTDSHDHARNFTIYEPYYLFSEGRQLYIGHLETGYITNLLSLEDNLLAIESISLRSNLDIELTAHNKDGELCTVSYCRLNKKFYSLGAVTQEKEYLKQRNDDLLSDSVWVKDFQFGPAQPASLQPLTAPAPDWPIGYNITDESYMAVEQRENDYYQSYASLYPKDNQLYFRPFIYDETSDISLGYLGEGDWLAIGHESAVGLLLGDRATGNIYFYSSQTGYLHFVGQMPELTTEERFTPHGDPPHCFITFERTIYRFSHLSGKLEQVYRIPPTISGKIIWSLIWSNDIIQLVISDEEKTDYGYVYSYRTGKTYHVPATFGGGLIETDWDSFYPQRRADLNALGYTEQVFQTYETNWSGR